MNTSRKSGILPEGNPSGKRGFALAVLGRNLPYLLRRTIVSAAKDGSFSIAKGAAYSSLLSFFPVLTSAAALLFEARAKFIASQLTNFLSEALPPGTDQAVITQFSQQNSRPMGLLIAANLLALWAASSVIKSLIEGFHAAYRVPKNRNFFHQTGIAILLVFAAVLPFVAASALILFGQQAESQVLEWFKIDPMFTPLAYLWQWLSRAARYVIAVSAMVSVTAILYYFAPYRRQRWRVVIPGAVLATTLFFGATLGFGWYIRNVTNYNVLYGSIGTGIALLVWMYLLALISILGCEFNAEFERLLGMEYHLRAAAAAETKF